MHWHCPSLLAFLICTSFAAFEPALDSTSGGRQILDPQVEEWEVVQRGLAKIGDLCGAETVSDGFLDQSRSTFEQYLRESETFYKTIEGYHPDAAHNLSCSSFMQSNHVAIHQSSAASHILSSLIGKITTDIITGSTQTEIFEDSICITSRLTDRIWQMLKSILRNPTASSKRLFTFNVSGGESQHIHDEIGIAMMRSRRCAHALTTTTDDIKALERQLQHTLKLHQCFIHLSLESSKLWDPAGSGETSIRGTKCTWQRLEIMKSHARNVSSIMLVDQGSLVSQLCPHVPVA